MKYRHIQNFLDIFTFTNLRKKKSSKFKSQIKKLKIPKIILFGIAS